MIHDSRSNRRALRWAACLGAAVLTPATTLAASNQAKNRCNDAIQILRSNPSMRYQDVDVGPLETKAATAHWNQVLDGWNRASKKINEIPKDQLKKEDPDLKECFEVVQSWGAYIRQLNDKLEGAQKLGAVVEPFLAEVTPYQDGFLLLAAVQFGGADVLNNTSLADAKRILDEQAKVEQVCAAKVPEAGKTPPTLTKAIGEPVWNIAGADLPRSIASDPNAWCFVAKNRSPLMGTAVGNKTWIAEGYGNWSLLLPEAASKLESREGFLDAWMAELVSDPSDFKAKLKKQAQDWYRGLGLTMPAEPFTQVDRQLGELRAKVDGLAPSLKFPDAGHHDGSIEGNAKSALGRIFGKAKVVRSTLDSADWTVTKNGLGVPLDRFRSGQLLFKMPGDKWCRQRTFSYVETYVGGGKFQSSKVVQMLPATRFLGCD